MKILDIEDVLRYEVRAGGIAKHCPAGGWLSRLCATYYAWKVKRKYRAYLNSLPKHGPVTVFGRTVPVAPRSFDSGAKTH